MRFKHLPLAAALLAILTATASADQPPHPLHPVVPVRHVLLISVDGLHHTDLSNWIKNHPTSSFAGLSSSAVIYENARTTTPSDSFPGLLAMVTGGTPKSTGVYYDDSYDRTLFAPGSHCTGAPGIETVFDESIDNDDSKLFSDGINPANLPLAKTATGACQPVYPHDFIRVNTIFEVVKQAGGTTAWSDKHPAYDLVNGPSGHGVDDLYTPEINSLISNGGTANGVNLSATLGLCNGTNSLPLPKVSDYTTCLPAIEAYDDIKVQAVINQVDGRTSDGASEAAVPTLFGMNFQAVSIGEKLPVGGYVDAEGTPSSNLSDTLAHTDQSIGRIVAELETQHLFDSTLIIISAKHGQSPVNRNTLAMESGGHGNATVQDPAGFIAAVDPTVDSPSSFTNPNSGNVLSTSGHLQTDDVGLVWLQNQSSANIAAVQKQLQASASLIFADTLPPGTVFTSSISAGPALAKLYGDPTSADPVAAARAPNILIQPNAGVIYSGSSKKIAEHGGGTLDDTHVALMVAHRQLRASVESTSVSTTQIAPTILHALKLDEKSLDAVRLEGTEALPGLKLHP